MYGLYGIPMVSKCTYQSSLIPGCDLSDAVLHPHLPSAVPSHVRTEEEGSGQRLQKEISLKLLPQAFCHCDFNVFFAALYNLNVRKKILHKTHNIEQRTLC